MATAIGSTATTVASTAASTLTLASLKDGAKKFLYLYAGSGAKDIGTALHNAPKGTFKLGEAFNDCFTKHTAAVASEKALGNTAKTSLFKKIGGLFGKFFGPALMIGPELLNAYQELKNGGGIGGALKTLAKSAIGYSGFPISSFILAALGIGGGPIGFVAGIVGGMVCSWAMGKLADMLLGKTNTELIAEQKVQQGGQTEIAGMSIGGNQRTLASIDAQIKETDEFLKKFDINSNSCISTTPNFNNYGTYPNSNQRVFVA